nr:tape measure protein [Borrelia sp. BU AG58]
MKLEDIMIPIAIAARNEDKLESMSKLLNKMAGQRFNNVANLEKSVAGIGQKNAGVKSLGSSIKQMGKNLVDVKGFASKVGESMEGITANITPMAVAVKILESIGSAIAAGFTASLEAVESFNSEVDKFSGMLASEDLGKALAEDMRAFGQETLFSQEAITNAASTLLSYGATADETRARMSMFAEVAGDSSEGLEKIAEVYAKTESSNRIALEDLEALRDMGLDITDVLAEQAGVGGEALFKMASEGKLGFADLNSALQKATAEGGKFYQNTAREARTLTQSQEQTAKMSQKMFLQLGQALEPVMMGFEKG